MKGVNDRELAHYDDGPFYDLFDETGNWYFASGDFQQQKTRFQKSCQ